MIFRRPYKRIIQITHTSYCQYSDVVKLAYSDYNRNNATSVPIIVLHGLFGARGNWNSMCTVLEQRLSPPRRIITIDARNHGDSGHSNNHNYEVMTNDVVNFLKELNLPKVICMGHSMGGRTSMYLTLKHPQLIEKLIVVDTVPITKFGADKFADYAKTMMDAPIIPGTLREVRNMVNDFFKRSIDSQDIRSFFLTNLILKDGSIKWRLNLDALGKNYENISKFPVEPSSGLKFEGPTIVIGGGLSDGVLPEDHQTIKEFFPKATIVMVKDAGHNVHIDKPEEFRKIVLDFLK